MAHEVASFHSAQGGHFMRHDKRGKNRIKYVVVTHSLPENLFEAS
jgi:hypothetical protein